MSTHDNNYYRGYLAYHERVKHYSAFEVVWDEFPGEVDISWVKSCVAICAGHGKFELQFARRILPNLERFVAVDRDHESIQASGPTSRHAVLFITF